MKPIFYIRTVVILLAVVGIVFAGKILYDKSKIENTLPYFTSVPEFEFITQDSVPFGLNEIKGKITVVDFMFTRCKGPCPIMSKFMGELYNYFENQTVVQFVSISVDPQFDTLLALQEYAKLKGVVDNRWIFLSASMQNVISLCEAGFKLGAEDLPGAHSTKFILVDSNGQIRGYYSGIEKTDIGKLKHDIESLL